MSDDLLEAVAETETVTEEETAPEVPSVFSITNRHIIAGADVSDPAEDGSRLLRLVSMNGQTIIEASLSPALWEYIINRATAVEIIEEDADADAPTT